jgi:hypothetical protein
MTDVSRYQEFILDPAGEHALSISERSVAKRGVDNHLIFGVSKAFELSVR